VPQDYGDERPQEEGRLPHLEAPAEQRADAEQEDRRVPAGDEAIARQHRQVQGQRGDGHRHDVRVAAGEVQQHDGVGEEHHGSDSAREPTPPPPGQEVHDCDQYTGGDDRPEVVRRLGILEEQPRHDVGEDDAIARVPQGDPVVAGELQCGAHVVPRVCRDDGRAPHHGDTHHCHCDRKRRQQVGPAQRHPREAVWDGGPCDRRDGFGPGRCLFGLVTVYGGGHRVSWRAHEVSESVTGGTVVAPIMDERRAPGCSGRAPRPSAHPSPAHPGADRGRGCRSA
jgi:hypothetical protein